MSSRWFTPLMCLAMAIGLCFVSSRITFEHRDEVIQQQVALLNGQAWSYDGELIYRPMFQNRLLFPALMVSIDKITPLNLSQSYQVARLLTVFVALWIIAWVAQELSGPLDLRNQLLVLLLLFHTFIYTFNFPPGEWPSDLPDGMFTALFAWCAFQRRYGLLAGLSLLAALNRESAAFSGIIWVLLTFDLKVARSQQARTLLEGAALSLTTYAWVLGVRHAVADHAVPLHEQQYLMAGAHLWGQISLFLKNPNPSAWPFLMAAVLGPLLLILGRWTRWDAPERELGTAALVLGTVTLIFGAINELRVFIPSLVLLYLACTHRLARPGG